MTHSMTGYASREGVYHGWRWTWEVRGVNGRGLDIRLRLPDWPGELDPPVRAALQKAVGRGNVTISLKMSKEVGPDVVSLNDEGLGSAISLMREAEVRAEAAGLTLAPMTAADVLAFRGVLESGSVDDDAGPIREAVLADVEPLIAAFNDMRAKEGAALEAVLSKQVDQVADTVAKAREVAGPRSEHMAASFREALARVVDQTGPMDEARVAQEIAAMAVKADVTEEFDRLDAHVDAARALLKEPGPKGRKLEFLIQEFNREANTLCSKAGFAALTALGLDLKHVVDQMREQVQNVE